MRKLRKKLLTTFCLIMLFTACSISVAVADMGSVSLDEAKVKATCYIYDPETDETLEWDIPASNIQVSPVALPVSMVSAFNSTSDLETMQTPETAIVSFDVGEYLLPIIAAANPSVKSTKEHSCR